MKKIFTLLLICVAIISVAQEKIPAIITKPGALAALKGHIQGACCSEDAIYLSHVEGIFKLDWNGNVLKHTALPKHTGDICYWRGRIYDALYNDVDGETNIIVLDDDINIIGSFKTLGGGCATVHNGILYVGTGPRDSKPHYHDVQFGRLSSHRHNDVGLWRGNQIRHPMSRQRRQVYLCRLLRN